MKAKLTGNWQGKQLSKVPISWFGEYLKFDTQAKKEISTDTLYSE